jgi:hypothetical protein
MDKNDPLRWLTKTSPARLEGSTASPRLRGLRLALTPRSGAKAAAAQKAEGASEPPAEMFDFPLTPRGASERQLDPDDSLRYLSKTAPARTGEEGEEVCARALAALL